MMKSLINETRCLMKTKQWAAMLGTAAVAIGVSTSAMAGVSVGVNLGAPVYVAPAPVYAAPPPAPVYYPQLAYVAAPAPAIVIGWHDGRYWDGHRYWERHEWEEHHHGYGPRY